MSWGQHDWLRVLTISTANVPGFLVADFFRLLAGSSPSAAPSWGTAHPGSMPWRQADVSSNDVATVGIASTVGPFALMLAGMLLAVSFRRPYFGKDISKTGSPSTFSPLEPGGWNIVASLAEFWGYCWHQSLVPK